MNLPANFMTATLVASPSGAPRTVSDALGRSLNPVEAKNAPPLLYGAGKWELLQSTARVSIVGSRKASGHGLRMAASLAAWLVAREYVVLSGLAEGIDTAAHTAAIDEGGRTIGVIGTSLEFSYPASNKALQAMMTEQHLVISQFKHGMPSQRANFPRRNRTMALLSDATVIIEAQDGSGSFHQGWEALRLGRPLYILRSSVENQLLTWPAEFISFGAYVLEDADWEPVLEVLPGPLSSRAFPFGD